MVASGAAFATVATIGVYEGRDAGATHRGAEHALAIAGEHDGSAQSGRVSPTALGLPATGSSGSPETAAVTASASGAATGAEGSRERLEEQLARARKEKGDLATRVRKLESAVERHSDETTPEPSTREPAGAGPHGADELDLDREDWKKLAAEGRVKYRIPCLLPPGSPWSPSESALNELGLSPGDGEAIAEAHRRSNARIWDVVRPLCEGVLGDPGTVDLLGGPGCLRLIRQFSDAKDPAASREAQRQVAEVQAGLRPRPAPGEPLDPMFRTFMALTDEGRLFEADLAESFGPEDAKRIARSNRCTATLR